MTVPVLSASASASSSASANASASVSASASASGRGGLLPGRLKASVLWGGATGDRTPDPYTASVVLSQLSYRPKGSPT